jgi:hypothetical protein
MLCSKERFKGKQLNDQRLIHLLVTLYNFHSEITQF